MTKSKVVLYSESKQDNRKRTPVPLGRGRRPNLPGPFLLRFTDPTKGKQTFVHVGYDLPAAIAARDKKEAELSAIAAGVAVATVNSVPDERNKLDDAIAEYLTTGRAAERKWSPKTLTKYTSSLALFRKSCAKGYIEDVSAADLKRFKVFLSSSRNGFSDRTVYNHFLNVVCFLNEHGRTELIKPSEWPEYEAKRPIVYSEDEI